RLDAPADIAAFARARADLAIPGGMLVANPIPSADEIPPATMRPVIEDAVRAAAADGVTGKQVTPFLLDAILKATGGRSLAANIALVSKNARLAAEIAVALAA